MGECWGWLVLSIKGTAEGTSDGANEGMSDGMFVGLPKGKIGDWEGSWFSGVLLG